MINALNSGLLLSAPTKTIERVDELLKVLKNEKEVLEKEQEYDLYTRYNKIIDIILKGFGVLYEKIDSVKIVVAQGFNAEIQKIPNGWACVQHQSTSSNQVQITTVNGYNINDTIFIPESYVNNNNLGEIASTIIHELSHVFLNTLDIWYFGNIGKDGEDSGQSKDLTKNADSFSVFAKYLYSSEFKLSTLDNNGQANRVKKANPLPRFDTFSNSIYKATYQESE